MSVISDPTTRIAEIAFIISLIISPLARATQTCGDIGPYAAGIYNFLNNVEVNQFRCGSKPSCSLKVIDSTNPVTFEVDDADKSLTASFTNPNYDEIHMARVKFSGESCNWIRIKSGSLNKGQFLRKYSDNINMKYLFDPYDEGWHLFVVGDISNIKDSNINIEFLCKKKLIIGGLEFMARKADITGSLSLACTNGELCSNLSNKEYLTSAAFYQDGCQLNNKLDHSDIEVTFNLSRNWPVLYMQSFITAKCGLNGSYNIVNQFSYADDLSIHSQIMEVNNLIANVSDDDLVISTITPIGGWHLSDVKNQKRYFRDHLIRKVDLKAESANPPTFPLTELDYIGSKERIYDITSPSCTTLDANSKCEYALDENINSVWQMNAEDAIGQHIQIDIYNKSESERATPAYLLYYPLTSGDNIDTNIEKIEVALDSGDCWEVLLPTVNVKDKATMIGIPPIVENRKPTSYVKITILTTRDSGDGVNTGFSLLRILSPDEPYIPGPDTTVNTFTTGEAKDSTTPGSGPTVDVSPVTNGVVTKDSTDSDVSPGTSPSTPADGASSSHGTTDPTDPASLATGQTPTSSPVTVGQSSEVQVTSTLSTDGSEPTSSIAPTAIVTVVSLRTKQNIKSEISTVTQPVTVLETTTAAHETTQRTIYDIIYLCKFRIVDGKFKKEMNDPRSNLYISTAELYFIILTDGFTETKNKGMVGKFGFDNNSMTFKSGSIYVTYKMDTDKDINATMENALATNLVNTFNKYNITADRFEFEKVGGATSAQTGLISGVSIAGGFVFLGLIILIIFGICSCQRKARSKEEEQMAQQAEWEPQPRMGQSQIPFADPHGRHWERRPSMSSSQYNWSIHNRPVRDFDSPPSVHSTHHAARPAHGLVIHPPSGAPYARENDRMGPRFGPDIRQRRDDDNISEASSNDTPRTYFEEVTRHRIKPQVHREHSDSGSSGISGGSDGLSRSRSRARQRGMHPSQHRDYSPSYTRSFPPQTEPDQNITAEAEEIIHGLYRDLEREEQTPPIGGPGVPTHRSSHNDRNNNIEAVYAKVLKKQSRRNDETGEGEDIMDDVNNGRNSDLISDYSTTNNRIFNVRKYSNGSSGLGSMPSSSYSQNGGNGFTNRRPRLHVGEAQDPKLFRRQTSRNSSNPGNSGIDDDALQLYYIDSIPEAEERSQPSVQNHIELKQAPVHRDVPIWRSGPRRKAKGLPRTSITSRM